MMLLRCCAVASFITLTLSAAIDIERTIQQVQNILQENSSLPRLSREEIIGLLNDIQTADAKKPIETNDSNNLLNTKSNHDSIRESKILSDQLDIKENLVDENTLNESQPQQIEVETTTKSGTTLMVVLPYTPRDGSSLQELYTKPPRVEVVTENPTSTNKADKLTKTLQNNAEIANSKRQELSSELQAFLDAHGLKDNPDVDHFLLPLDGFKPLPPVRAVDASVQLPENILLTYDLISSSSELKAHANVEQPSKPNDFLFDPLPPEFPFELDMSPSETEEVVFPYDLPKSRKAKSISNDPAVFQNDDEYKVIPLQTGLIPLDVVSNIVESDISKRQTNDTEIESKVNVTTTDALENLSTKSVATTEENKPAEAMTSAASETDTGASISDLEDSFGGAAPENPGDSQLPPPKKNGFYWMLDWNSFLEVGDGRTKVNIHFEPKLGDPQMFIPVNVP